jgi:hypothetical protein
MRQVVGVLLNFLFSPAGRFTCRPAAEVENLNDVAN